MRRHRSVGNIDKPRRQEKAHSSRSKPLSYGRLATLLRYRRLFPFDALARSFARGCSFRGSACSGGGAFSLRIAIGVSKNALRAFSNESSVIGSAGLITFCTPLGTQLTAIDFRYARY